jgi:hypothetical protein
LRPPTVAILSAGFSHSTTGGVQGKVGRRRWVRHREGVSQNEGGERVHSVRHERRRAHCVHAWRLAHDDRKVGLAWESMATSRIRSQMDCDDVSVRSRVAWSHSGSRKSRPQHSAQRVPVEVERGSLSSCSRELDTSALRASARFTARRRPRRVLYTTIACRV